MTMIVNTIVYTRYGDTEITRKKVETYATSNAHCFHADNSFISLFEKLKCCCYWFVAAQSRQFFYISFRFCRDPSLWPTGYKSTLYNTKVYRSDWKIKNV